MTREGSGEDGREDESDSYNVKLYRVKLYREPPRTWGQCRVSEDEGSGPDSFRLRRGRRRWF